MIVGIMFDIKYSTALLQVLETDMSRNFEISNEVRVTNFDSFDKTLAQQESLKEPHVKYVSKMKYFT